MGFSLSPSQSFSERDLTMTIPAVSSTICGMVGQFEWGACNERVTMTNDTELFDIFGVPNDVNYLSWFSAFNYLQYSSALLIVRVVDEATSKNAGFMLQDTGNAVDPIENAALLLNDDAYEQNTPTFGGGNDKIHILAKYPGVFGNTLKVAVANDADFSTALVDTGISFVDQFEFAPVADEVAICVMALDDDNAYEIVERWIVSVTPGNKVDNVNTYIDDYIFQNSAYILAYNDVGNAIDVASFEAALMSGGVNGVPGTSEIQAGFDKFENAEEVDVNMIIDAEWTNSTMQQYIIDNLLEVRRDMVGYFSPPQSDVVGKTSLSAAISDIVDYRKNELSRSTSYAGLFGNWKYQEDTYNGKFRWLPVSADCAGIMSNTGQVRELWIAGAGYNRGIVKNTIKFAINPGLPYRDLLYKDGVNPLLVDSADGPVLLGQKTLLTRPSYFNRLDIRWLFIVLEKAIATASKWYMFEKNTAFTQRQFKGMIDPFLRDVQGKEGIENFEVQVGSNINTDEVKARFEFRARIFIQPTVTQEFIKLEFVNVKSGVEFSETISKSA
jgi:phage tail sheath protein FI